MQEPRTKVALQGFRAATVATMEQSTTSATAAGGGLPSPIRHLPGFGICSIAMALFTATTIRGFVFLFVVSGIDNLSI